MGETSTFRALATPSSPPELLVPTLMRRLLVASLAVLTLATGAVTASAASAATGSAATAAYAEIQSVDGGTAKVTVALGQARTVARKWWEPKATQHLTAFTSLFRSPEGTLTVSADGRTLGTFDLSASRTIFGPGVVEVDVPGGTLGTVLTVTYSGDANLQAGTHKVALVRPPVALTPTIDSFTPNGDGTFAVRGTLHLPAADPVAGPLTASSVTLQPLWSAIGRDAFGSATSAPLSTTSAPSELPGFETKRTWSAPRVGLNLAQASQLLVSLDDAAAPYHVVLNPASWGGNVTANTLQLTTRVSADASHIEISHLRGPHPCDIDTSVWIGPDAKNLTVSRWWPKVDGAYCRGAVPIPAGERPDKLALELLYPIDAPLVWVDLAAAAALEPRSLRLVHERTDTSERIVAVVTPAPTVTLLEQLAADGKWYEVQRTGSYRPVFDVKRVDTDVTLRVRALEDTTGREVISDQFVVPAVVPATPPRPPAEQALGVYPSHATCTQMVDKIVAGSNGQWNGGRCEYVSRIWSLRIYRAVVTYTP